MSARDSRRLGWLLTTLGLALVLYAATAPLRRHQASAPSPAAVRSPAPDSGRPRPTKSQVLAAIQSMQKRPPTHLGDMLLLANLYLQSNQYLDAVQELERAIHRYPRSAQPLLALGQTLSLGGFKDRAMDAYRRSVEVDSGNAAGFLSLSIIEAGLGWTLPASQDAERAAAAAPNDPAAAIALSQAYFENAMWPRAIAATKRAIELSPQDPNLWLILGQVEGHRGMTLYSEAYRDYQKALELGGPPATIDSALGYLELNWSRPGHLDRSVRDFKQALSVDPNAAQAPEGLTSAYTAMGRVKDAIALLEDLKRRGKLNSATTLQLGQLYMRDGQTARGQALLSVSAHDLRTPDERARIRIGITPSDWQAHFQMGAYYLKKGKLPNGVVELREALRLKPGDPSIREALVQALLAQDRRGDAASVIQGKPLVDVTALTPL